MSGKSPVAVIVGAGQAGARAARAMRNAGYVGAIHIYGDEQHFPYERPPLSKSLLKDPGAKTPFVFGEGECEELALQVHVGCRVIAVDCSKKVIELDGGELRSFDRLLLATGSTLRPLEIAGLASERVHYLRTLDDCRGLARLASDAPAIAVVGGGFIGLEVAATMHEMGCAVTVIELSDHLLPRLNCLPASQHVQSFHEAKGITFRLGRQVLSAEGNSLILDDGSTILADQVIAGIGVMPNTALAEAAGLDTEDGIVTDEYGRTSSPDVYAAGDVARYYHRCLGRRVRLESWHSANEQALAAGNAMAGTLAPSREIPWVWSDQGALNLQIAGVPEKVDETLVRSDGDVGATYFQISGSRLVGVITVNQGRDMTPARRMLASPGLALPVRKLADSTIPLRKFLTRV